MAKIEIEANRTEGQRLYSAWRYARSQWDQAIYDPARCGDDLPEEVAAPLDDADEAALLAYLLHPAATLAELTRKLQTFHQEGVANAARAHEITGALYHDARRLAHGEIASVGRSDAV